MMDIIETLLPLHSRRFLCRILGFNRSSFYSNQKKNESQKAEETKKAIRTIALKRPYYGYRRTTHELKRQGYQVNHKYVYMIMRQEGILCKRKRKFVTTTDSKHNSKIYPNLKPKIIVTNINQLWVADITYIRLNNNKFAYFAHVLDSFSRKCIGWDLDIRIDDQLCINTLKKAFKSRQGVNLSGLIHHSDRGKQYASAEYIQLLKSNNIMISMSRKGNPYDNPIAERFFKTFKYEKLYLNEYDTFSELQTLIASFVDDYNNERLHSSIGYCPPNEYERLKMLNL
jgi:putative transposase